MARPFPQETRDKVLEYLKNKWFAGGATPFRASLAEIAEAVGEKNNAPKILSVIKALQSSGNIVVTAGNGRQSNLYSFRSDSIGEKLSESKQELQENIEDAVAVVNKSVGELVQYTIGLSQENLKLKAELMKLKSAIGSLNKNGILSDGRILFSTKDRSFEDVILAVQKENE